MDFFNELDAAIRKEEAHFQMLDCGGGEDIGNYGVYIWGASLSGLLLRSSLADIRIDAVFDSNPNLWNEKEGICSFDSKLCTPQRKAPLILLCIYKFAGYEAVAARLCELHIPYINAWALIYKRNFEQLKFVHDRLLSDSRSKETYQAVIRRNIFHDDRYVWDVWCDHQYFALPQFNQVSPQTVFVDCGAYVGDTLEEFVRRNNSGFKRYIAFEPAHALFHAMSLRTVRLCAENLIDEQSIVLENRGVGKAESTLTLAVNSVIKSGSSVSASDEGISVPIVSLDQYFSHSDDRVTCIKADIEGAEYDMLTGAKKLIQRDHPNLAISIYHDIHDLFRIPLLVHELVPEYKMAVRHHSVSNNETILYCYIE